MENLEINGAIANFILENLKNIRNLKSPSRHFMYKGITSGFGRCGDRNATYNTELQLFFDNNKIQELLKECEDGENKWAKLSKIVNNWKKLYQHYFVQCENSNYEACIYHFPGGILAIRYNRGFINFLEMIVESRATYKKWYDSYFVKTFVKTRLTKS